MALNSIIQLFLTVSLILAPAHAFAGTTYTPRQLWAMVNNGNYPDQQGVKKHVQRMDFKSCVTLTDKVMSSITPHYPVSTIVDTSSMKLVKAWTNDAAMTVVCSKPDGKMIMTTAPYK